jgi:Flp pilus assembly secretin CpaC
MSYQCSHLFTDIAMAALIATAATAQSDIAEDASGRNDGAPQVVDRDTPFPADGTVEMTVDFVRVLTFDFPVSALAVGNSEIVDVSLSDDRTVIVTGRAPGVTNVVALGDGATDRAEARFRVSTDGAGHMTVFRGTRRQTYTCGDGCTPIGAPGETAGQSEQSGQVGPGG